MKAKYLNIFFLLGLFFLASGFTIQGVVPSGATSGPFDYAQHWKEVKALENKRKPRSAIDIVNKIYAQAKKDKNQPQMVKAVEYGIRLSSRFEEDHIRKAIAKINQELSGFTVPSTQILHSLLADLYMGYYFSNRHLILDRTNIADYELTELACWDQKMFTQKIFEEFSLSLKDPALLQKTPVSDYALILTEGDSLDIFRPGLYDLLAHHALEFFKNDEFMASRPAIRFELDDPQMLDLAEAFVNMELQEKEEYSLKFHALSLYQALIKFHLNDPDPAALVDLDLNRLNFIYDHAIFPDKEKLYLHTLQQMETRYMGQEAVTEIYHRLALMYYHSGDKYKPLVSDEHKRDKLIAVQYCENAIKEFPASYGAALCKILLKEIKEKSLHCELNYASLPGKPFLSSVSFKNISTVYLRVIPLDPEEDRKQRLKWNDDNKLDSYRKVRPVKQWSIELPVEEDHQLHRTEIAIPLMTEGYYGLLISDNPAFEKSQGIISINNFWLTGISYISNKKDNGDLVFYVLDRASGAQIPEVNIDVYEEVYDNREYHLLAAGSYTSNEEGFFIIPSSEGLSQRLVLDFIIENDRFTSPNFFYLSKPYDSPDRARDQSFFFTDRSIYRPGQTVYFKGILLEKTGEKYEIQKHKSTTVRFFDVNNQKVSELQLQTNDYGSFHGSFTAPVGRLTGNMRIQNESGQCTFSVEEYKRPKFEVVFDPVKGSYKLDSEVTLTGKALAYSGNAVDHAKVKYRIVRNVFYPFRNYWWHYYPESPGAEIAFGEVETDDKGTFSIDFTAIPDRSQKSILTPVFNYTVYVDITDIGGETRSGEKTVSVGEKSLLIDLGISDMVNGDETNSFTLKTTNLNGEAEPARVDIKITQLKVPGNVLHERKWQQPDIYLMTQDEFKEKFPNDVYKDEENKSTWEEKKTVFTHTLDTKDQTSLELNELKKWQAGEYKVLMKAEDVFGEEVIITKFFTLYSSSSDKLPLKEANWFVPLKTEGEPGETAIFLIGTAYKDVRILYEVSGKNGPIKKEWLELSNEQIKLEIPIREEDRGGLGINLVFINHNHSYSNSASITVAFTNKKLDISFETFRNKLLPGQKESWNIRIRSDKGDKVAAEMLAGMYDASLDAFTPHNWHFNLFSSHYFHKDWSAEDAFVQNSGRVYQAYEAYEPPPERTYDFLYWKGLYAYGHMNMNILRSMSFDGEGMPDMKILDAESSEEIYNEEDKDIPVTGIPEEPKQIEEVSIRRNLQETAFFFPDLKTNADGDVIISFTLPESLTRWKMMGMAYTKDLSSGMITKELVTQKDLMVIPNPPRFFREGDEIWFSAKVVNMSEDVLNGEISLQLFDAISMKPVDDLLGNDQAVKEFTASEGNSQNVYWKLNIPENTGPLMYRVIAQAANFSDGEEMVIPVLKNRMLVTESMPLPINGNETKNFTFEKLANSQAEGSTLSHYSYTLEFTSNPAWYAVQALPYLMEYPYECSEQIFNRVYANSFAAHIVKQHPKIKKVFESWMTESPDALLSNLEKNQDLKNALLEETPWVMQAKNESERKKRIALLFDLNKMDRDLATALNKLQQNQLGSGGWPWFAGGQANNYITRYIVSGFGKMQQLGILDKNEPVLKGMMRNAIRYIDDRMFEDFTKIKNKHKDYQTTKHLDKTHIQYLYARSFFADEYILPAKYKEGFTYFKEQAKKYWTDQNKYLQGMTALALHRLGDEALPSVIIASIKEHALYNDEMGMYWRQDAGYYWYEAHIETQALLIEAFDEVAGDKASVELMKTWLLKQKQTHDWKTSKATADACYALLLRGANLIAEEGDVTISIGGKIIDPGNIDGVEKEAGTGYFQHQWHGQEISSNMANITVSKANDGVAWGAVYWQYFEDLDKITAHTSPLSIQKKLFLETYTDEGPLLIPVNDGDVLRPGDKVISRIEIRTDRDMEFVHMKDMRATALEPRNFLSGYHWQGGMGYYESIRDASVNFFFSYLRKGTWVFEYPLNVTQKGTFSNGISTIQCMYAPEFASHSEGVSIRVE